MITISFAKIPFPFPCSLGFSLAFDLCPIGIKKKKSKKKKGKGWTNGGECERIIDKIVKSGINLCMC